MKFAKVLSRSGQSLLAARARGIANTVKQEQEALIADSKRKAQGIINELTNLMDLSINSTTSLTPVSKDFNPKRFVEEIQNKKSELRDTLVDWKIAIETHNEWFPEEAISMPKELAEVWGLGITLVEDEEEEIKKQEEEEILSL